MYTIIYTWEIKYKIKYSRPNRRPARSGRRPGRRPGEHVFFRVLDIFPSESAFFSTVTYMFGLATHLGDTILGALMD